MERHAGLMGEEHRRIYSALVLSSVLHAIAFVHYGDTGLSTPAQSVAGHPTAISIDLAGGPKRDDSQPRHLAHVFGTTGPRHVMPEETREAAETMNDKPVASAERVDEIYYTLDMLDSAAQPTTDFDIAPFLPGPMRTRLLLEFWIDKNGDVRKLLLIESTGTQAEAKGIIESLRTSRFSPAIRDGMPVNSRKLIELVIDGAETVAAR